MAALSMNRVEDSSANDSFTILQKMINQLKEEKQSLEDKINTMKALEEEKAQLEEEITKKETHIKELEEQIEELEKEEVPPAVSIDKTAVMEKIKEAELLKEENYTQATWEVLKNALASAKLEIESSESTESTVEKTLTDLKAAIENLKTKEAGYIELAENFKKEYSDLLAKSLETLSLDDKEAVESAIASYESLSTFVKEKLNSQKEMLDSLSMKIEELEKQEKALQLLEKAEKTKLQSDLDVVRELAERLPENDFRIELNKRIQTLQDDIDRIKELQEAILKAEQAIKALPSLENVKIEDKELVFLAEELIGSVKVLDKEIKLKGEELVGKLKSKIIVLEQESLNNEIEIWINEIKEIYPDNKYTLNNKEYSDAIDYVRASTTIEEFSNRKTSAIKIIKAIYTDDDMNQIISINKYSAEHIKTAAKLAGNQAISKNFKVKYSYDEENNRYEIGIDKSQQETGIIWGTGGTGMATGLINPLTMGDKIGSNINNIPENLAGVTVTSIDNESRTHYFTRANLLNLTGNVDGFNVFMPEGQKVGLWTKLKVLVGGSYKMEYKYILETGKEYIRVETIHFTNNY